MKSGLSLLLTKRKFKKRKRKFKKTKRKFKKTKRKFKKTKRKFKKPKENLNNKTRSHNHLYKKKMKKLDFEDQHWLHVQEEFSQFVQNLPKQQSEEQFFRPF